MVLRFFVVRVYIRVSHCLFIGLGFWGCRAVSDIGSVRVVYGLVGFSVFHGFKGFCD